MNKKNIIVIVQARLTSKRFPNKVIKKIGKETVVELILKRLKKVKKINKIVFSIPANNQNNELYEHLKKLKANIFRGSENNVLDRFYKTSIKFKATDIIRITADCPLVDPQSIDKLIDIYLRKKPDYLNNALPPNHSDGFDVEIFNFKTLKLATQKAKLLFDKEHVTPFMKKSKKVKKLKVQLFNNYGLKLSIDSKKDYIKVKKIFKHFYPNIYFSVKKIFDKKIYKKLFQKDLKNGFYFNKKTEKGQKLWNSAKKIIPGGNMLISKNPERFLPDYWPTYFKSAKGCKIKDLDGNQFIDFSLMGIGTNVLGYGNSKVDNAVKKTINNGNMSTLNCPEEVALAEKLIEIHPTFGMVKFARTGGEANSVAIRIARAASGRDNIAICGYHGWHDWYLSANLNSRKKNDEKDLDTHLLKGLSIMGVPKKLKKTVFPFNYGKFEQLNQIVKNNNIGVIKMEVCRNTIPDINFLKRVRKLASKNKIVLIFDECTTGFRQSYGGLYKTTGVEPDMVIFGKAMGNGYAITAVLGKKEIMEYSQKTFISSTFWTERIGPTAALKTIDVMKEEKSWIKIKKIGKKIQSGWKQISKGNNVKININGIPSLTNFSFQSKNNQIYKTLITQEMLKNNILASNSVYCCTQHNDNIIDKYFNSLDKVFKMIKSCEDGSEIDKYLRTKISIKGFQRLN